MPIRFVDKSGQLGRLSSTLASAVSAITGSFTSPLSRTGSIAAQLQANTATFIGQFQANAARTGSIASTLSGVFSSIFASPGSNVFPLAASSDARYLVGADAAPRPILGRTSWQIISATAATYQSYLTDTVAKGFNAIEMNAIYHWPGSSMNGITGAPTPPVAGNGSLPFTNRLDGAAFTGALTYSNINTQAPDFSTPNETYWVYLDTLLNYCASQGILVLMFPSYVGYNATDQGWMAEMVANGATKMQTYGAFIANRYKTYKNIVWMLGGDKGTAPNLFTTAEKAVEQAMITGIQSVTGQLSTNFSAEWEGSTIGGGSIGTDQADFGGIITLNGAYSWVGQTATYGRLGYARSPTIPAYYMEGPYDEEGPDGNNFNPNAVQPVRRFNWQGWLSSIAGYVTGNGFVWPFGSAHASHLNTPGAQQCAILNAFIKSINWYRLVPSGLGTIGTLVTAGGGTIDATTYVAAAASPLGELLVAYVGPGHTGTVTIDMTKVNGSITARWFDPTNGNYTAIGTFANTGTRAFTIPGANSVGANDWVLRLDGTVIDTIPDAFAFVDQSNVPLSTTITSAPITVTGITAPSPISVAGVGGSGHSYDINGSGTFLTGLNSVNNNDTVRARHVSSAANSSGVGTTITIGGPSNGLFDEFRSTTVPPAGSIIHGSPFTISGISIESRASPQAVLWDNGTDAAVGSVSPQISSVSPTTAGDTNFNMKNRNYPFSLGTAGSIPAPHARTTRGLFGGHYGQNASGSSLDANAGYDVLINKSYTRPAAVHYLYMTQYVRYGANWTYLTDNNHKDFDYSNGADPYAGDGQYFYTGWFLSDSGDPSNQHVLFQGVNNTQFPDQNGHGAFFNLVRNPVGRWVRVEYELKLTSDNTGYVKCRQNNLSTLSVDYLGRTDAMTGSGNTRCASFGGYSREYQSPNPNTSCVRSMADNFILAQANSGKRLMLANSITYTSATQVEPQNVTAQPGTSVTFTANLGIFTPGATVYAHYGSFKDGWTQIGPPLTVTP